MVSCVEDTNIPVESFEFIPTKGIISSVRDDIFLIDFIGVLCAKSDLILFEKKAQKSHYMKIELDDLSGSEKLSCTLWENYASEFGSLLNANKSTKYIIVLQFAKMKFFNGVMTITNTNFKTKILVNADLEVVKKFCQKLIGLGHKQTTNLKVIGCVVRPFPFEDFHVYTICINFSYQGYHQGSVFKCVSLMIQIQQLLCCLKMLPLSSSVSLPLTSAAKRSLSEWLWHG
ncbi:uncharacterized protein LOC110271975 isoform X2 [Arachis ipaensis]|uniref:uncharacterized protein LOC110271975 isoform X2 n=1 Tax=Arachis ipaensis TaxID=130454 RepID=UPI000A2B14E3|nr:uncharacterized protein LOC110271975 isoform X2 [Arachis ipaensis]